MLYGIAPTLPMARELVGVEGTAWVTICRKRSWASEDIEASVSFNRKAVCVGREPPAPLPDEGAPSRTPAFKEAAKSKRRHTATCLLQSKRLRSRSGGETLGRPGPERLKRRSVAHTRQNILLIWVLIFFIHVYPSGSAETSRMTGDQ